MTLAFVTRLFSPRDHAMSNNQLEIQLVEAIQDSELGSLAADYAELGVDALLDEGLLKDVPVLGTLQRLYNFGASIQNRMFAKKMLEFLINLESMPKEKRQDQLAKLVVDVEERRRVGENVLLLLDRMNDMSKPKMMAKAFSAYLKEEIDKNSLYQLWHALDAVNVAYLSELKLVYTSEQFSEKDGTDVLPPSPEFHHLAVCGLLMFDFGRLAGPPPNSERISPEGRRTYVAGRFEQGGFKKNTLGQLFVQIMLKGS